MEAHIIKGREPISEEQMYELYNIDKTFRDTAKLKHNNWVTTVKRKDGEIAQAINHQTTIDLKPKYWTLIPEWTVDILEALLLERWIDKKTQENGLLAWANERRDAQQWLLWGILLTDTHFDLLDVDNNSINKRFLLTTEKVKRTLDRVLRFDPDKLLVANMGDMFNSDGRFRTTSWKVTMQNVVSEEDAFKQILDWTIQILEYIQWFGLPMEYRVVPWNHDYLTTNHYGVAVKYYFLRDIPVIVEKDRAYIKWWKTLICLGHWDNEKPANFLQFAVDEFISKNGWIEHIHWYLGNQHQSIISQNWPMQIKNLLAPNPKSKWCQRKGYDMKQWQHWFVWSKDEWEIAEVRG